MYMYIRTCMCTCMFNNSGCAVHFEYHCKVVLACGLISSFTEPTSILTTYSCINPIITCKCIYMYVHVPVAVTVLPVAIEFKKIIHNYLQIWDHRNFRGKCIKTFGSVLMKYVYMCVYISVYNYCTVPQCHIRI